ncbi:hypothetical protein ABIE65_001036 [Constrictibacter sp. MBR-5]|uniref:hypothetical protein n=1 Tax=Constrictibacter sp. MBR-5 TaxID=3156467 RepID=UPI003390F74E
MRPSHTPFCGAGRRAFPRRLDGILIAMRALAEKVDGCDETTSLIVLLDLATEVVREAYPSEASAG